MPPVAENVGVSGSMDDIVHRLEASPEHRDNMLSSKYTHQAVGTARGNATLPVVVDDRVAAGCAWIESGYGATAPLLASGKLEVTRA